MEKKKVKVKSSIRKGKFVKAYTRNNNIEKKKNNILRNTAIGVGATVGIGAAVYAGLKFRYLKNLDNAAKSLKDIPGKVIDSNKEAITFTIGGFGAKFGKDSNVTPLTQAKFLKRTLPRTHERITLNHQYTPIKDGDIDKNAYLWTKEGRAEWEWKVFENQVKPVLKGRNDEAVKLAQEIYSSAIANPTKPINIIGFSAGGALATDIGYMLNKKGIKVNIITIGNGDFKFVPKTQRSLHINSTSDPIHRFAHRNTFMLNKAGHRLDQYLGIGIKEPLREQLETRRAIDKFLEGSI